MQESNFHLKINSDEGGGWRRGLERGRNWIEKRDEERMKDEENEIGEGKRNRLGDVKVEDVW